MEKEKQSQQFSKHQIQLEEDCSTPPEECPPSRCRRGTVAWPPSWQWDLPMERQQGGVRSFHQPDSPGAAGKDRHVQRAENTPSFLLGYFTSSSLLGSCALAYTAGRKRKRSPPAQNSTTNSALGSGVAPPATTRSPVPPHTPPGGFAASQSLDIPLLPAAHFPLPHVCWLGTHPALCPCSSAWPPCSSPHVFFGGGGPCTARRAPEARSAAHKSPIIAY